MDALVTTYVHIGVNDFSTVDVLGKGAIEISHIDFEIDHRREFDTAETNDKNEEKNSAHTSVCVRQVRILPVE
jgi:hypothetical protein